MTSNAGDIPQEYCEPRDVVRLLGGPLDNQYRAVFRNYGKMLNQRNNHYSHCQDFLCAQEGHTKEGKTLMRLEVVTYMQKPSNTHEWVFLDRRA